MRAIHKLRASGRKEHEGFLGSETLIRVESVNIDSLEIKSLPDAPFLVEGMSQPIKALNLLIESVGAAVASLQT